MITFFRNRKVCLKSVSVVIPAYNEANTIGKVIEVVKKTSVVNEIIVVDDGSDDETAKIARDHGVTVISHTTNHGKGEALKTGLQNSKCDVVAFIDGDLNNLNSNQIEKIVKPILDGKADVTKTKFKRRAGRVTELTAKPLLKFFFPELKYEQPLSGQFAATKTFLNKINFEEDYGVDIGIVLDADAQGMRIKEVDIGHIEHEHSSIEGLNLMANEVVRTIINRAVEYGRVSMMDSLGKYIRMSILGLSLTSLGLFSMFFISKISPLVGIALFLVGLCVSIYYFAKFLRRSIKVLAKSDRKSPALKSFLYMHFQILLSGLILMAMIFTLVGSAHISSTGISIQPISSNLVWTNQGIQLDFRGPYTVDSALSQNEIHTLRLPAKAKTTLNLKNGDVIYMENAKYVINDTITGEGTVLRMSEDARRYLSVNVGETISNTDINNKFTKPYIEKNLTNNETGNLTINEGIFILPQDKIGRVVNIYVNNKKVVTTSGIFKNGYYSIYINNNLLSTIYVDNNLSKTISSTYYGENTIKIEIAEQKLTSVAFANSDTGKFLNIS
jgi:glycosyltransferase involved in cell wall biosynthesis